MFEMLDLDRSGSVSFDEFIEGVMRMKQTAKEKDVATLFAQINGAELSGDDLVQRTRQLKKDQVKLHSIIHGAIVFLADLAEHGEDPVLTLRRGGAASNYKDIKPSLGSRIGTLPFGNIVEERKPKNLDAP